MAAGNIAPLAVAGGLAAVGVGVAVAFIAILKISAVWFPANRFARFGAWFYALAVVLWRVQAIIHKPVRIATRLGVTGQAGPVAAGFGLACQDEAIGRREQVRRFARGRLDVERPPQVGVDPDREGDLRVRLAPAGGGAGRVAHPHGPALGHEEGDERELADQLVGVVAHPQASVAQPI